MKCPFKKKDKDFKRDKDRKIKPFFLKTSTRNANKAVQNDRNMIPVEYKGIRRLNS